MTASFRSRRRAEDAPCRLHSAAAPDEPPPTLAEDELTSPAAGCLHARVVRDRGIGCTALGGAEGRWSPAASPSARLEAGAGVEPEPGVESEPEPGVDSEPAPGMEPGPKPGVEHGVESEPEPGMEPGPGMGRQPGGETGPVEGPRPADQRSSPADGWPGRGSRRLLS